MVTIIIHHWSAEEEVRLIIIVVYGRYVFFPSLRLCNVLLSNKSKTELGRCVGTHAMATKHNISVFRRETWITTTEHSIRTWHIPVFMKPVLAKILFESSSPSKKNMCPTDTPTAHRVVTSPLSVHSSRLSLSVVISVLSPPLSWRWKWL